MFRRTTITVLLAALAASAEPLDRIAVTVGTYVITESAVILDLKVGAFLDRTPVDLSAAAKRRSAERLTDMALILQEANESHMALPTVEQARATLDLLKKQYGNEVEFAAEMRRYGVTERDITAQLHAGIMAQTFSDLRFRPVVQISDEDLRELYERVRDGATFEESRDQMEALLTRERVIEALDAWLATARQAAGVQFREKVFE